MSTSPLSDPSFSPNGLFARYTVQHLHAALKLNSSMARRFLQGQPVDYRAICANLPYADMHLICQLYGVVSPQERAAFRSTPDSARYPSEQSGRLSKDDATTGLGNALFADTNLPTSLIIHPYLGDSLTMIADDLDMDFDDLVSLFVQYGLQHSKKSLKEPFPGAGASMLYSYDYQYIPTALAQQLNVYATSTGWTPGHLLNCMLHYSLLRYYAGKLVISTGLSAD